MVSRSRGNSHNAGGIVDRLDLLVDRAEDQVGADGQDVAPKEQHPGVFGLLEVHEQVAILVIRQQEVQPAEEAVDGNHDGDELPVVAFEDAVRAQRVEDAGNGRYKVHQLEVDTAAPAKRLVAAQNPLLEVAFFEPVVKDAHEVADDAQRIQHVVAGLQIDGSLIPL